VTQWLDDQVPSLDAASWRLRVRAGASVREWSWRELDGFSDRLRATIDCTGGWYAEQEWQGVWLDRLLPGGRGSVVVTSVTGYRRRFPASERGRLLLATRVGGRPLEDGHGFPARIVAPGRRGFWWVKWVREVELDGEPWWWQPPFPLT
jgi:DMSO/TMAO reductase YedYZ molybdopterin-dependent catalytic subunit